MRLWLTLVLSIIATTVYAGDYVCYDNNGEIISKHRSIDGSKLGEKCIKVDSAKIEMEYYQVKNGKLEEKKTAEKDAIDAAKASKVQAVASLISSIKTKLKGLGLTDEEADILISNTYSN